MSKDKIYLTVIVFLAIISLIISCVPSTTFMRSGVEYTPRQKDPEAIAIYFPPKVPERNYKIVGTIIVSPNEYVRKQEEYLKALKKKAAEIGIDGVMNVEIKEIPREQTQAGCISGVPYYYKEKYNIYEIKGDAFVWE